MEKEGGAELVALDNFSISLKISDMRCKKIFFVLISGCLFCIRLLSQNPIDIIENTVKVGAMADEIFYFGFAAGDKMIFNFEEVNGKEVKEVEIQETPSYASKFIATKIKKITNKIINITTTGIYKFRISNTSILPKTCMYKIQRIPASLSTINFDPTVYTDLVNDTTYDISIEEYLEKIDTVFITFQDRLIRVNPASTAGGNKAVFNFLLPANTIVWSYYFSTNKEGVQAYDEANKKLISNSSQIISKFPYYNVLSAVALDRPADIKKLQAGLGISYWIFDAVNLSLFNTGGQFRSLKNEKAINDFSKMTFQKGNLHFGFLNEHATDAINVTIKIAAVQINEVYNSRQVKKMLITPSREMHLKN